MDLAEIELQTTKLTVTSNANIHELNNMQESLIRKEMT